MAYGILKCDNITFDNGGSDQNVTVSGLYRATTSGVTVTGTISGAVLVGTTTVSGATVTGNIVQGTTVQGVSGTFTSLTGTTTTGTTANFASGVFTTRVSGTIITGDTGQFTSGTFVSLTGTTITGTTINAVTVSSTTGTFTSLTGTTITGTTINGVTVAATTGSFTSLTGTTTSGTTANFVSGVFTTQVSGTTVTGTTSNFTSGNFATLSGATATFTSGVIALGTATNPSLSFVGDPNTGIYSPGADQLAVATNGQGRLFVAADGKVGVGVGNPVSELQVIGIANIGNGIGGRLRITTDSNLGYIDSQDNTSTNWQPLIQRGTDIQFHTNTAGVIPAEKVRITSAGLVGIGTSSPRGNVSIANNDVSGVVDSSLHFGYSLVDYYGHRIVNSNNPSAQGAGLLKFQRGTVAAWVDSVVIDNSGNVGIGTTSPVAPLHVATTGSEGIRVATGSGQAGSVALLSVAGVSNGYQITNDASNNINHIWHNAGGERARIDSSGRLLVGTSTARTSASHTGSLQLEGTTFSASTLSIIGNASDSSGAYLHLGKARGGSIGSTTVVADGDTLGQIHFTGSDGTNLINGAIIAANVDGPPGSNDLPTRLVFSTTADGAASPTERMRIDNAGAIYSQTIGGGFRIAEADDANWHRALSQGPLTNWTNHIYFRQSTITSNRGIKFSTFNGVGVESVMLELNNGSNALFPSIGTTASAANAFLDNGNSNSLLRSTSSRRYKTNIEDIETQRANAILELRPVWYRSIAEADRDEWSWYGLIAEEVAEIEPRLVHWTYLEKDYEYLYQEEVNKDGSVSKTIQDKILKPNAQLVPDGVQYDRLTVLLLDVVKRQQQTIESLESRVAALEAA